MVRRAGPSPRAGAGDGGDDRLLLALECEAAGLTWRDYALRFWEPDEVEAEFHTGSWMHGRVKRRYKRARAVLKHYIDIAASKQAG